MTDHGQSTDIPMLKRQYFGVEIECTGITRMDAARVLGEIFESRPNHDGGTYGTWSVIDPNQKTWKLVSDASISGEMKVGNEYRAANSKDYQVELVTPKLEYAEMSRFQEVIRALRGAGAKVNSSCGMHVHVDGTNHNERTLKNLLSIMYSKEELLFKALQVPDERSKRWCQPVREEMLDNVRKRNGLTITQLERLWYNADNTAPHRREHYNWTRYHAINLHSMFYRGTVEFRCFNSTLHAGVARAYVILALAISAQAIEQRATQMHKTHSDNEKFTFRTWLLRLGLIGKEFENPRKHLLEHLDGNSAWRYDRSKYPCNKPPDRDER